jgi:hypothetical protein
MVGGGSLEIVRMFEREDVALRANWEDLRFSFQDLESRRVLGPGEEAFGVAGEFRGTCRDGAATGRSVR